MQSAIRLSSTRLPSRLSDEPEYGPEVHGLAGEDLTSQWIPALFALRGRSYSTEFMRRMHHPFGEVLGVLFLDAENKALTYHACFRGDRPSALSHLPGISKTARELGAARVILAYNMIFDPNATLPDVRRMHARMAEAGVELHDFLILSPGQEPRSLLTGNL